MNLFDLAARITLDSSGYDKSIAKAAKNGESFGKKMKDMLHPIDNFKGKLKEAEQNLETQRNKMMLLSNQYKESKKKVSDLTEAFNKSARETGITSDETKELAEKLKVAEKEADDAEREFKEYSKSLNKNGKEAKSAEKENGKLASTLKNGIAGAAKVAAKAMAVAFAAAATGVSVLTKKSVQAYAEYEQLVGGVDKLFGESSKKLQEYAAQAYKTSGMSASQYMEQATSFSASLINSLGGDTAKAADIADVAMRAMADNVNTFGTDMGSVQAAFQGFAKQNYTLLDNLKLGYGGTKTEMERLIEDANRVRAAHGEMADLSIEKFSDVILAIQTMQEEQGIAGTTAKEASKTISGSVEATKAAFQNLVVGFSDNTADIDQLITNVVDSAETAFENIMPVIERALEGIATFVQKMAPIISKKLPSLAKKLIPPVIKAAGNVISGLISALPSVLQSLMSALPGILDNIITVFVDNLPKIVELGLKMLISLVKGLSQNIGKVATQIVRVVIDIAKTLTNPRSISELIKAAAKLMIELAKGLIQGIPELLKAIPEIIGGLLQGLIQGIAGIGDEIAKALFGIGQKTEEYSKKISENATKAREFGDALKNMKPQIADVNALLSKSGNTLNDLDEAIKNDEDAITTILQEALKNQQDLRDEDIRKIEEYKENIKRLEEEKLEIYRSQQLAELTKIGLEISNLDEQQAAQRLANAKAALDQINQATEEAYTNELALVEKEWAARKETDAAGYQAALDAAKLTYDQRMRENQSYYSQTTAMISEATNTWTGLETKSWSDIGNAMEAFKTNSDNSLTNALNTAYDWLGANSTIKAQYAGLLSQMDLDTERAFFDMQAQHVAGGNAMSEANKQTVSEILSAFDGLPDGLSDVGKEALLGMVGGLSEQIPELKDTSEMSAQEIVDAVKKYLKISSPSKVMAEIGENAILGIMKGQNDTAPKLRKQTEVIVRGMQNTITNTVGRFRSIGGNLGNALATGFSYQRNSIISRIQGVLSGVVSSVNFFLGIRSPSRVFKRIGAYSAEGFGVGFQDEFSSVKKDVLNDFDALVNDVDVPVGFGDDGYDESIYSREFGTANQPGSRIERLLEEYLPEMIDTISQMRVYLDTGTLVGRITPALDVSLGRETIYRARAN